MIHFPNFSFFRIVVFLGLLIILWAPSKGTGQTASKDPEDKNSESLVIGKINVEGNRLTKTSIILRELLFHEHDTLQKRSFSQVIKASRDNVFNTRLFNFVSIDTTCSREIIPLTEVTIHVVERWYIWPVPFLEISDRNFNAWLQNMDFSRLTYGIDLTLSNVRGRNETLKFPVHFGFNREFGFNYNIPYINRRKTFGLGFGVQLDQNHELIVKSENNKPVYFKDPDLFIRQNIYSFIETRFRPSIYSQHILRVAYNNFTFTDSLRNIKGYTYNNPYLSFFTVTYQFRNDHRDIAYYPVKGYYFDFFATQNGLFGSTVNEFFLKTNLRGYFQIFNRWYYATGLTGKYTFSGTPKYFLQQGLGYGRDYVRGYEYFVVDGIHYALLKNNLKFSLIRPGVIDLSFVKSKKFNPVPYAFYLNFFVDLAYVYNMDSHQTRANDLQNSLLIGYGIGIDFATYYDLVGRMEFSVTRDGKPGIFLHFSAPI